MIKPWAERMRDGMSAIEARTQEIKELRAALVDRYPQIEALTGRKPRSEFLDLALHFDAVLTGKPDGSEAITVQFPLEAWWKFDEAMLSATAPQVVADERALQDALRDYIAFAALRRGELGCLSPEMEAVDSKARAALAAAPVPSNSPELHGIAAAPVQAQEPVAIAAKRLLACVSERKDAEISFTTAEGHTEYDRARHQLQKALSAPEQPVAVPDGYVLVPIAPSDEALRVLCAVECPHTFKRHLRDPLNGPKTSEAVEQNIVVARRQYAAVVGQVAPAAQGDKMMCVKCHSSKVAGRADCPECGCKTFSQRAAITDKAAS